MNKITEAVQDKGGKISAMRVALFVYLIPLISSWMFISISNGQLQTLDNSLITGLGLLIGGKSVQSFSENKVPEPVKPF